VCAGKQVIHPGQIQVVQEEFSPSQERVQWAKELIAAFDQHQKEGKVKLASLRQIWISHNFRIWPEMRKKKM